MEGQVLTWNDGAEKIFGYTAEEMVGNSISLIVPETLRREEQDLIQTALRGERIEHYETTRRHKSGAAVEVSVSLSPIRNQHGVVVAISNIARDISARNQGIRNNRVLESQLQEARRLEAIGILAGGIAHDFNNALASILGNAELARGDVEQNSQALISIEEIIKTGKRSHQLVQQILAFSRRQPFPQAAQDLAQIIEHTVRSLALTVPTSVTLECDVPQPAPIAMVNAAQIEQVLINLVSNAVHALAQTNGTITIGLAPCEAIPPTAAELIRTQGPFLKLSVSDTGPGVPQDIQGKLFDPFFTTKGPDQGTGLGLSVVHGIVTQHQGAILLDSSPNNGTTFSIYLPACSTGTRPTTAAVVTTPTSIARSGLRLLYLDDDQALTFLVQRQLARRGYHVHTCNTQDDALAALQENRTRFDLFITDYHMPNLSGIGVAKLARDICPGLPIAITSGYIDGVLEAQARALSNLKVFLKATSTQEFCDAIDKIMAAAILPIPAHTPSTETPAAAPSIPLQAAPCHPAGDGS